MDFYSSVEQPDDKRQEECVVISLWENRENGNFAWNDFPCTHKVPFVCKLLGMYT